MEKDFNKQFTKCPQCNSEDRFFEQLSNEMKERGLARPEFTMCLDSKKGVVLDPAKQNAIPIGSEVPGYAFKTDICMDCGCIYAIDITRSDAKKAIAPQQMIQPNRAQRRRDLRGPGDLQTNLS